MKTPEECAGLDDIRAAIDAIDADIIEALGHRLRCVKAAAAFKPDEASIADPDRVGAMIPVRRALAENAGLDADFIGPLFAQIIHWFIIQQIRHWKEMQRINK